MIKKTWILAGLLFLLFFVAVSPARAENYCFPTYDPQRCWSLMQIVDNYVARWTAGIAIGVLKAIAGVAWIIDRAAAFIYSKSVVDNAWLLAIKDQMLNGLSGMMPGALRQIAFGQNGLMYVALSLAGLLMMIPLWGMGARFVRAERVLVWGALLSLLFVAGTFGYDFIGQVEGFRQALVRQILGNATAMPLDRLILQPMMAGEGDLGFGDDLLALPPTFGSIYFPSPTLIEVTISEGGFLGFGNALVEQPEEISRRIVKAALGAFYGVISIAGAWLLFVVGISYIMLAFVAILLIIFLFAALPLGFFEIGGVILQGILGRYMQLIVQSFALAIFLRLMAGWLGFVVDVNSVPNALQWLVVLIITNIIAGTFFNGALRIVLGMGSVFSAIGRQFGGPSAMQYVGAAAQDAVAKASALVGAGALLAGRPDIAVRAMMIGHAARSIGSGTRRYYEDSNSIADEGASPRRTSVFDNNGFGAVGAAEGLAMSTVALSAGKIREIEGRRPAPVAQPARDESARLLSELNILAARYGLGDQQKEFLLKRAATAKSEKDVEALKQAPGFDRMQEQDLMRAIQIARALRAARSGSAE
jgi:hypothetical protein